ncbi:hypothetical protein LguiA_033486 [Lonicera macranthoides]
MAFRGRGRGRGGFGGGGGFRAAKQVPFELFPEIADFPDAKSVKEEMALAIWSSKLQTFWNSSPYYYEGVGEAAKNNKSSDKDSERTKPKPPLSHFIKMTDEYVPAELGERKEKHSRKKVRWNPESDQKKIDLFEKLEKKGQDDKGEKEKKEGEDEEEDDEAAEEEEEFSDDGDYNQNIDFDDDEDDFNIDEGDDEAIF